MTALEYLTDQEWSMNGWQCPDCCGVTTEPLARSARIHRHDIGHEDGCPLATAIRNAGGHAAFQHELCPIDWPTDDNFQWLFPDAEDRVKDLIRKCFDDVIAKERVSRANPPQPVTNRH